MDNACGLSEPSHPRPNQFTSFSRAASDQPSPIQDESNKYNNFRLYGTILLVCMATIVFVGVKFVNIFATIALVCVLGSIISVYVGIFVNTGGSDALM